MDVVNRIVKVRTGPGPAPHANVPVKPVIIEQARLIIPPDKQDKAKQ
jgi:hypothetical protein